jgi:hypothetical protein
MVGKDGRAGVGDGVVHVQHIQLLAHSHIYQGAGEGRLVGQEIEDGVVLGVHPVVVHTGHAFI